MRASTYAWIYNVACETPNREFDRKGRGMKQRPEPRRFCSSSSLTFRDVP